MIVVSEENAQISLVERARIVRNLNEAQLSRALRTLLDPNRGRRAVLGRTVGQGPAGGRAPRIGELGRMVRRRGRPRPDDLGTPEEDAARSAAAVNR